MGKRGSSCREFAGCRQQMATAGPDLRVEAAKRGKMFVLVLFASACRIALHLGGQRSIQLAAHCNSVWHTLFASSLREDKPAARERPSQGSTAVVLQWGQ